MYLKPRMIFEKFPLEKRCTRLGEFLFGLTSSVDKIGAFNPEIVRQHVLIRAKYHMRKNFRNGLVTFVQRDRLTCLFQMGVNASTSYYSAKASEVADGLWELIYTNDFQLVY